MAGLSNLATSKASNLFNQAQQQLAGNASSNILEELSRHAEEQLGNATNRTLFGQNNDNPSPASLTPPPANAFYGYGRPLPATAQPVPSYVAPSGCTGHAPGQTGPAPCQWCS